MFKSIKELTDKIFEDVPYSKITEDIKDDVTVSMQEKYEKLQQDGKSQIQAMGNIMDNYGTPSSATKLVDADLPNNDSNMFEEKDLKKLFHSVRIITCLCAFLIDGIILAVVQAIIEQSPKYLISIFASLLVFTILIWQYRKKIKLFKYDSICLSTKARNKFYVYIDRYKKNVINSVFIFVCAIALFISRTFERAKLSSINDNELLVLVQMNIWIIGIAIFLLFKYILDLSFLFNAVAEKKRNDFWKFLKKWVIIASVFTAAEIIITAVCSIFVKNSYIILYLLTITFVIIGWLISFYKRKVFVRKNGISKRVISLAIVGVLVFTIISQFQKDVYVLQPYIMSVSKVEHNEHEITYDKNTGEYTIKADNKDFKILHLTDIHIGGSVISSYKDYKALEACKKLIDYSKPDFVIVTGDMSFPMGIMSFSLNNRAPVVQFASFMRNIGIPWAFTYGNHDTESIATDNRESIDALYKSLSFENTGSLLYPNIKPDITGRCNQLIKIENEDGSIRQALFLIDSNDYTGLGLNDYDYIHDDQVDWYAEQVQKLSVQQGKTVPSLVFFHIPLQEYRTAYQLYEKNSDEVKYYFGFAGEKMINKVCCSNYPSKLFDTAVELGSTKAMFCGHDHYNNISLEYKGIRLTYGMSIDYLAMPGIDKDKEQRGGELITIKSDSSFDIKQIPLQSIE